MEEAEHVSGAYKQYRDTYHWNSYNCHDIALLHKTQIKCYIKYSASCYIIIQYIHT